MENLYITKIIKVGTSLGVVIPVPLLKGLKMQRGDVVVFCVSGPGHLYLRHLTDIEIKEIKQRPAVILS